MSEAAQKVAIEQNLEYLDDNVLCELGEIVVDRRISEVRTVTAMMNGRFRDGTLRGVSNATISVEGHQLDDRRRPYSMAEIELLLTLPSVVTYIEGLRTERGLEAKDAQYQAKVEALAHARAVKAAKHDRSIVPALYAEVVELRRLVEWLVDGMDRQIGVPRLKQGAVWTLPDLKD
jgi:hypothetical protein